MPQRSIRPRTFASRRGGTSANFGRQAPWPPADFGRHGAVHDDRDGPAGEPPEDAPSGESEGRDVRRDGGGQARRHGGPRPPRERLPPRPGVRGGAGDQSVCPPRPHGPSRALEQSGYEKKGNWRLTTLLDGWNVEKVKRLGASAAKLLVFFNPDAPREIVDHQVKVVQSIADECQRLDLTFVCEPMSYPVDESEEAFAHHKADTVIRTAEALSPLGIDVLKAEFPGDPKVAPT